MSIRIVLVLFLFFAGQKTVAASERNRSGEYQYDPDRLEAADYNEHDYYKNRELEKNNKKQKQKQEEERIIKSLQEEKRQKQKYNETKYN